MIFHENRLLADDSHDISFLLFRKLEKMSQNVSSAAFVIGALRVKNFSLTNGFLLLAKYFISHEWVLNTTQGPTSNGPHSP